ncbi:uncharacterized protein LOC117170907 [Belonocnema kinseyi]|uniref:uncharacterized protein LOC117170907 n=1 Tax=Belonocnema kinseyi TaxID=2817044 RepID=UPI00143DBCF5|nr:uncharacterized protein LOC117170907 [Belonocnema kinseyi]
MTVQHVIELKDPRPLREPARLYCDEKRLYIDTQVREMLSEGFIEPSTSPCSWQIVIATKKMANSVFANWQEHLAYIALVLERLDIYGLKISPEKCHFGRDSLPHLGHWISSDGNAAQPKHIDEICNAPLPRTRRELQSFIATCN